MGKTHGCGRTGEESSRSWRRGWEAPETGSMLHGTTESRPGHRWPAGHRPRVSPRRQSPRGSDTKEHKCSQRQEKAHRGGVGGRVETGQAQEARSTEQRRGHTIQATGWQGCVALPCGLLPFLRLCRSLHSVSLSLPSHSPGASEEPRPRAQTAQG